MSYETIKRVLSRKHPELWQRMNLKSGNAQDIITRSDVENMNKMQIFPWELQRVYDCIADIMLKPELTASELLKTQKSLITPILFPSLPKLILPSSIVEFAGSSGTGKTQALFQLALQYVLPEPNGFDSSVLYFDMDHTFSSERLAEMLVAKNLKPLLKHVLPKMQVYSCNTVAELMSILNDGNLDEMIISSKVKLIVIDSLATPLRRDYSFSDVKTRFQRQSLLSTLATRLKLLCSHHGITCLISNQMLAHEEIKIAALGVYWSHAVNVRFIFECNKNQERTCRLVKSPHYENMSFDFKITNIGLVE